MEVWVERIKEKLKKSAESLIELGHMFRNAKSALPHGDWKKMFDSKKILFSLRTAERLMRVADNSVLASATNSTLLPVSLDTLCILARLDKEVVQDALIRGDIHPGTTIAEATLFAVGENRKPGVSETKAKPFDYPKFLKSFIVGFQKKLKAVPRGERGKFLDEAFMTLKERKGSAS